MAHVDDFLRSVNINSLNFEMSFEHLAFYVGIVVIQVSDLIKRQYRRDAFIKVNRPHYLGIKIILP